MSPMSRAGNRSIDRGFEFVELDRFDEVLREAGLQTSFDITVVAKAADRDPRDIGDCAHLHHQIHSGSIRKGISLMSRSNLLRTAAFMAERTSCVTATRCPRRASNFSSAAQVS